MRSGTVVALRDTQLTHEKRGRVADMLTLSPS
jgi:hypothetical protein